MHCRQGNVKFQGYVTQKKLPLRKKIKKKLTLFLYWTGPGAHQINKMKKVKKKAKYVLKKKKKKFRDHLNKLFLRLDLKMLTPAINQWYILYIFWGFNLEYCSKSSFGLIWFDLVWFGLVWFNLVWFSLVCFSLVWLSSQKFVLNDRQLELVKGLQFLSFILVVNAEK